MSASCFFDGFRITEPEKMSAYSRVISNIVREDSVLCAVVNST
jgi:hypothetical protein